MMILALLAAMTAESLYGAIRRGDEQRTAQVLAEGVDPNSRGPSGMTPLMLAANLGHKTVASALVGAGADLNAQDDSGKTALVHAAGNGHTAVAALLLKAGADPNIRTRSGRTALDESRLRRYEFNFLRWMFVWARPVGDNDPLVRLLIEAGAKP